jgi:minichromosome maintenance protein 10
VPVEGDWVAIAVVAERGDVKLTAGAGDAVNRRKFKQDPEDEATTNNGKAGNKEIGKEKKEGGGGWKRRREEEGEDNARKGGKKYVNVKLIDLGHQSRAATSSFSAVTRGTLRGRAAHFIALRGWEGECDESVERREWRSVQRVFCETEGRDSDRAVEPKGVEAIPGACSKFSDECKLCANPPHDMRQNTKNPSNSSILARNPPSAAAIAIIGYAADSGKCSVVKRNGKLSSTYSFSRPFPQPTLSLHYLLQSRRNLLLLCWLSQTQTRARVKAQI